MQAATTLSPALYFSLRAARDRRAPRGGAATLPPSRSPRVQRIYVATATPQGAPPLSVCCYPPRLLSAALEKRREEAALGGAAALLLGRTLPDLCEQVVPLHL